jgi:SSS family solute:Na+ symporter
LGDLPDSKQVIPLLLARVAGALGPGTDKVMLVALSTAALGSGAAILRAMASALASAVPATVPDRHPALALCALGLGAAVASRGQGIIDTMVSVNVVYIASIAICLVALMRGMVLSPRRAAMTMAAGFVASVAVYIAGWAGWLARDPDFISLVAGLGTSAMVAASLAFGAAPVPRAPRPGS